MPHQELASRRTEGRQVGFNVQKLERFERYCIAIEVEGLDVVMRAESEVFENLLGQETQERAGTAVRGIDDRSPPGSRPGKSGLPSVVEGPLRIR